MKSLEDIFTESYLPQYTRLYTIARAIVGDTDAADAVQDTMVKIWKGGEATNIYGITGGGSHGSTTLSSVLIETVESDEYSLVFVRGSINLSKLMEAQ